MVRSLSFLVLLSVVASCDVMRLPDARPDRSGEIPDNQIRPEARPNTLDTIARPPVTARTVEEFDTTTTAERSEAVADSKPTGSETDLGVSIASLGSPSEPGFWLKTPLVSAPGRGRVVNLNTGKSVAVDLIPIDGPTTAGSRLSLPAMRLIEAPLAGLPEIRVFRSEN